MKNKALLFLMSVACASSAWAVTPPSADTAATQEARFREERLIEPRRERALPQASISDEVEPKKISPEKSQTLIRVKGFHFLGNYSIDQKELLPLVAHLQDHDVTLDEIQDAVRAVKRYYRQKGFVATYAYVPPQEIKDGVLSIDVIEGRLGEVRIEGAHYCEGDSIRRQMKGERGG